jgi:hypothetical protein
MGDLRQADHEALVSESQSDFTSDKSLQAIRAQLKKRKEKSGNPSPSKQTLG